MSEKRERYRAILSGRECVYAASVVDPLSARLAAVLGYEVGLLAGSVASAVILGAPDIRILTLGELTDLVRRVARSTAVSLMVDADDGYGNALGVMRMVNDLEAAGAAAIAIDDTVSVATTPTSTVVVAPVRELSGKLRAAAGARQDPGLVLIARTRALRAGGIGECIERVRSYERAGADAIALLGVRTAEELDAVHSATALPLLLGSGSAPSDVETLTRCGVRIASQGNLAFLASVRATFETLKHLRGGGAPSSLDDRLASADLLASATDAASYSAWERDFIDG